MADVHVDYAQVQGVVSRLKTGRQEIDSQLKGLKAAVDQLVTDGFRTDVASPKFQESYQRWHSGASNAMAGLEGMAQFLGAVVDQHQHLDSQLSSSTCG